MTPRLQLPKCLQALFPCDQTDLTLSPAAVAKVIAAYIYTGALDRPTKPILVFTGPPGSGKTSTARSLVRLLEGPEANVVVVPKSAEDLLVVASSCRFLAVDNIESRGWLPDVLAATATGARFVGRKLYTDATVADIEIKAALILTSMDVPFSRADVLDRCIIIPMRRLPSFLPELEVQRRVEEARPAFVDALEADLDVLRPALSENGNIASNLRMADFAAIGNLVWGKQADAILEAIVQDQAGVALRDDPAVDILIDLAKTMGPLIGPAKMIRQLVVSKWPPSDPLTREMNSPRSFGDHLRRIADPGKAFGLDITWRHDSHTKSGTYTITHTPWKGGSHR